jgi:hypothetical protein
MQMENAVLFFRQARAGQLAKHFKNVISFAVRACDDRTRNEIEPKTFCGTGGGADFVDFNLEFAVIIFL